MVIPTDCYHKIGHTHIAKFFRPHSDYNPDASPICFLDWDHYCTNYPFIINQGMQGYVKRIERAKIVHQHDDSLQNSRPDQLFSADYPALDKQLVTGNVSQNYYL